MLLRLINRNLHSLTTRFKDVKPSNVQDLLDNAASFDDVRPSTEADEWATLPYIEGTHISRNQASKRVNPSVDPKDTSIILFPGQGAQYVGMAKNLIKIPEARDIFELASHVLKYD